MKLNSFFTLLIGVVVLAFGCDDGTNPIPECIERKMQHLEHGAAQNSNVTITMITTTTGKRYFYIPPLQCCDFFSDLYDEACNLVCHPDGGISGKGSENCPEYLVLKEEVIWRDKRSAQ